MITEYPHLSLTAIHECLFRVHDYFTVHEDLEVGADAELTAAETRDTHPVHYGSPLLQCARRKGDMIMVRPHEVPGKGETRARYP